MLSMPAPRGEGTRGGSGLAASYTISVNPRLLRLCHCPWLLLAACAATPELVYATDQDAGVLVDATMSASDAGVTGDAGGMADALADATPALDAANIDAGPDGAPGCAAGIVPAGGDRCCGDVPCVDRSGNGCTCSACAGLGCGGNKPWCCINGNQVASCKPDSKACK